jgi:hypothetical protein
MWSLTDVDFAGATNNLEWYVPQQIETKNGALVITLDKRAHRGMECVVARCSCCGRPPSPSTLELTHPTPSLSVTSAAS